MNNLLTRQALHHPPAAWKAKWFRTYGALWEQAVACLDPKFDMDPGDPWSHTYYLETDEHFFVYVIVPGYMEDGTLGRDSFLLWDGVIDLSDKVRRANLPTWIKRVPKPPVAYLDLTTLDLDTWLRSIQVQPTYVLGKKWQAQQIVINTHSVHEIGDQFKHSFDHKKAKFPQSLGFEEFEWCYRIFGAKGCHSIVAYDTAWLYTFLTFYNETSLMGFFIDVTDDPILRKRQRAYVSGHAQVVRLAASVPGIKRVEFGLYFDYKRMLKFDTEMRLGIDATEQGELRD